MKGVLTIVIILVFACALIFADETGANDRTSNPPSPPDCYIGTASM